MRRRARPGGGRQHEVTIEGVGARGDGYATLEDGLVYVPLSLAGDRVRLRVTGRRDGALKAEALELLDEGPGRVEPPCPHFGPCGGCALQHMEEAAYGDWKAALLPQALAHRGLGEGTVIKPMIRVPAGTRRRAVLAAARRGGRLRLGFHGRKSHEVAELETCLLLVPALVALLPALRAVLSGLLPEAGTAEVHVAETEAGPDMLIVGPGPLDLAARETLARFAEDCDLARLSWGETVAAAEPLVVRRPPRVLFGGVAVEPPPGAFLQPSAQGQAALTEAVLGSLPEDVAAVADLYCGCGTFSFPLSTRARVLAADGAAEAVAALWAAARRSDLAARVAVEVRDLAREPLLPEELARFDAVVFDPPRAGARAQAQALAESDVPCVIAVSCNPNSFARDARILVEGGYRLHEVMPVDQFPWSGHLELVAKFTREGRP